MNAAAAPAIWLTSANPRLRELLGDVPVVQSAHIDTLSDAERASVRAILTSGVMPIAAADMDRLPRLGLIVTLGAGYDGIDAAAASARGIAIRPSTGLNAAAVAEHAVALFLAIARRILPNDAQVREGHWRLGRLQPVRSVGAMRVGIVGMGAIGKAIAVRLVPFGCGLAWTGPHPKPDLPFAYQPDLAALARDSDALIIAAPLNPETRGIIDAVILDALGADGLLVNVGRGPIVDEDALIAALRAGRLRAAALDVFVEEPTPPDRWRDVPGVLLSPHTAGITFESMDAIVTTATDRARAFVSGG